MMHRNLVLLLISLLPILGAVADAASETRKGGERAGAAGRRGSVPVESSIVPAGERISDDDARLALARVLSYSETTLGESVKEYRVLLSRRPHHLEARTELADIYMRQKKYDDALRELRTVLSEQPGNIRAKLAVGRVYLRQGDYEKAIVLLNQIREGDRTNAEAHLELARAYAWSRQYDRAVDAYRQALQTMEHPDDSIHAEFADALLYSGRRPEAIEQYRTALNKNPSSHEIWKKLARALSWAGRDSEALAILEKLFPSFPDDREITIERARIYIRNNQRKKALGLLKALSAKPFDDVGIILAVADLEASLGHAKRCRDLYLKAVSLSKDDERLSARYADRIMMWGDFYGAEKIYRQHLRKHPGDVEIMLKLAQVLASSERYEEAEGLYRELLFKNQHSESVLLGLSALKLQEKNFDESVRYANRLLSCRPNDPEGRRALGDVLFAAGRYREALEAYQGPSRDESDEAQGLLRQGRTYLKLGDPEKAKAAFEAAYKKNPDGIETQFHRAGSDRAATDDFLKGLTLSDREAPDKLVAWARLYAENGHPEAALTCYRAALENDPVYFPAQMGLAEALAVHHQYAPSIDLYRQLALDFPGSSRILTGQARVLGWSRNYEDSLALYEKIHQLNPADPVVLREKARVALWAKRFDEAMALYGKLMEPPVDRQLLETLKPIEGESKDRRLSHALQLLEGRVGEGSVCQGYEMFEKDMEKELKKPPAWKEKVEFSMIELFPAYRIQKGADLERRAKELAWNKRYTRALTAYEDMIRFSPGNEEAIFDYAQVQCTLGLCDREKDTYQKLLNLDSLHSLARQALNRQDIRENPSLELRHRYWREDGRGDLSRIKRHRSDVVLKVPFMCRYSLKLIGHHWIEQPEFTDQSYAADGYTLAFDGILNPYLKGEAGWTHKAYKDNLFNDRDAGYGHVWFNAKDHVRLGAGFDRTDEIYNYFGLKQGIQTDTWWISAASQLTRKLDVQGVFRYLDYNDGNSGQYHSLSAGYAFTDHPRILKVILSGDYRDTRNENMSLYTAGTLTDITHPYWTPKNYIGGGVTLEWYHDLSGFFFCGSRRHFYDLRVSFGTDSTGNAAARLEGEWLYEFYDHWSVGVTGLIHRSREWNADGLFGNIKYQF